MLEPIGNRVIIQEIKQEEKTESGIILSNYKLQNTPKRGYVKAVGKSQVLDSGEVIEMELAVGDEVIYSHGLNYEVRHEGQDYIIMDYKDILGVVK
jgi:chaperonin GroES